MPSRSPVVLKRSDNTSNPRGTGGAALDTSICASEVSSTPSTEGSDGSGVVAQGLWAVSSDATGDATSNEALQNTPRSEVTFRLGIGLESDVSLWLRSGGAKTSDEASEPRTGVRAAPFVPRDLDGAPIYRGRAARLLVHLIVGGRIRGRIGGWREFLDTGRGPQPGTGIDPRAGAGAGAHAHGSDATRAIEQRTAVVRNHGTRTESRRQPQGHVGHRLDALPLLPLHLEPAAHVASRLRDSAACECEEAGDGAQQSRNESSLHAKSHGNQDQGMHAGCTT